MADKSFHELFLEELRDIYNAEKQLTKALPKMVKAASSRELEEALASHLEETEGQVERLEQVFESLGETARGKKCVGMEGLIEEADEALKELPEGARRDAKIIAGAQRVEHYEISAYGTARAWAEEMGHDEAVRLLTETLDEEAAADEKLNEIALGGLLGEGVNEEAEGNGAGRTRQKSTSGKKSSGSGGSRSKKSGKKKAASR